MPLIIILFVTLLTSSVPYAGGFLVILSVLLLARNTLYFWKIWRNQCTPVVPPLLAHALLMIGFWVVYGGLIGALHSTDFVNSDFLAGEGRVFFVYLPFIALMTSPDRFLAPYCMRRVLNLGFTLSALYLAMGLALRALGQLPPEWIHQDSGLRMTFSSHHAIGAFSAMVTLYFFCRVLIGRTPFVRRWIIDGGFMVVSACAVLATNSRTAAIAVIIVALLLWLWHSSRYTTPLRRLLPYAVVVLLALPFTVLFSAPKTVNTFVGHINPNLGAKIAVLFDPALYQSGRAIIRTVQSGQGRDATEPLHHLENSNNVLTRVYLWSIAVKQFLDNPILGIGYGRWNDRAHSTQNWSSYTIHSEFAGHAIGHSSADGIVRAVDVGNAHNTYLHILAETGIIGGLIVFGFWLRALRRSAVIWRGANQDPIALHEHQAAAAVAGVLFVLIAGLSGHAFAAPATAMLPLFMVGIVVRLSWQNSALCQETLWEANWARGQANEAIDPNDTIDAARGVVLGQKRPILST